MLTRPGLQKQAENTWTGDIRILLLNGTFDPITSLGNQILPSEVGSERYSVTVDTLQWSTTINAMEISVSSTFTLPQSLAVTRFALIGTDSTGAPNQYGNLPTVAKGAGTFSLALSTTHDITLGQLIYFSDGSSATIDTITTGATEDFTYIMEPGNADPATSAAVFPARGCLLGSYEPLNTGVIPAGSSFTVTLSGNDTSA